MNYANVRDRIYTVLAAVAGIGPIFKSRRKAEDWSTFFSLFLDANDRVNVAWYYRIGPSSADEGTIGSRDARNFLEHVEEVERWRIEFFYGFKDDENAGTPSEYTFQTIVDAILAAFRFEQDLNGTTYESRPLTVVDSGLYMYGDVLVHRATFDLTVRFRVAKTGPED